ncbi:chloramphenicol acetyltransferase [Dysgonomonas sp. 520]|uniref:chloramphenicol acetyltransferase n=1 Tax=Dysgonomonas sp. 520 TaxID=2302931 RepID=UPI0013D02993|nr:chloramphenicol acetyltransferase [Dysgonomonas sp. 520]NDW10809.1 chloramphenicol acetyltransferase [Dysgonomonas sp. 520]
MKHKIDKQNWNRIEHFEFFRKFEDPNHGIVTNIDCTTAYKNAKDLGESFYYYYLHKIMKAVNSLEEFRYRIEEDDVFCYDTIHCEATVGRDDHTFGFSFFPYNIHRDAFTQLAEEETVRVKNSKGLLLDNNAARIDVIHFSAVPWFSFTDLKHARNIFGNKGVPKISTGKTFISDGKLLMPMQIEVHHGLIDGWHLGQLISKIQELFDEAI